MDAKKAQVGTSLVVQWLRLCAPTAGHLGLIPGQGTRFHILHLRLGAAKYTNIEEEKALSFYLGHQENPNGSLDNDEKNL